MILSTLKSRKTRRQGAAIVEFAVVIPVFLLFVFALVEFGRGMMVVTLLNNAARAGCRSGILPSGTKATAEAEVNSAMGSMGVVGLDIKVKVNGAEADPSTAKAKDIITVELAAPAAQNSWLPIPSFLQGNLRGKYSLTRE